MSASERQRGVGRQVILRFAAVFVGGALVVLALGVLLYHSERENRLENLADLERGRLRLETGLVEREIHQVASDLLALSKNGDLGIALRRGIGDEFGQLDRTAALQLAADIENFARAKGVYDELLLHDRWGHELLRMEHADGEAVVSFPELANWDSVEPPVELDSLPADLVRLWMPDGNSDQLFFGAAIGSDVQSLGSLVLGYRSRELLVAMNEQEDAEPGDLRILDRKGNTLFTTADVGGFDPSRDESALWAEILGGEQGQILDAEGLTTYSTLSPRRWLAAGLGDGGSSAAIAEQDAWKLVSHVPAATLAAAMNPYRRQLINIYLIALGVLAVGSVLLAWQGLRSGRARREAEAGRDRLGRMLDDAREIVITASLEPDATGSASLLGLNRAAKDAFCFDDTEVEQMSVCELVAEADHDRLRRHLEDARLGRAQDVELVMVGRDGRQRSFEIRFERSAGDTGEETVLRGSARDVSDRRRAQDEIEFIVQLQELEHAAFDALASADDAHSAGALLSALADHAPAACLGWYAVYRDGRRVASELRDGNGAATSLQPLPDTLPAALDLSAGSPYLAFDELEESPLTVETPVAPSGCWRLPLGARAEGVLLVFAREAPGGQDLIASTLSRLGTLLGERLHAADLRAELANRQEELVAADDRTESAVEAGGDYLLGIAERMRRPTCELAERSARLLGDLEEGVDRRSVEAIAHGAWGLQRNIEEILNYVRLKGDELEIPADEFDWREVLKLAMGGVVAAAAAKGLSLRAEVEKQLPAQVIGAPALLRQVIEQLLDNAIRHTQDGEVLVKVQRASESAEALSLQFTVKDSGPGIPDEMQQTLFDTFEASARSRHLGRGLGLTLASRLVRRMGGSMWVQSAHEQGSSFHFTVKLALPLREEEARTEPAAPAAPAPPVVDAAPSAPAAVAVTAASEPARPSGLRVLVAEESEASRKRLRDMLSEFGQQPMIVDSGIQAIEAIALEDYDAIFLAVQMSEMDGLTTARAIRDYEKNGGGHLPIVAMSAEAMGNDRARCEAAGMDHYLAKPVEPNDLQSILGVIGGAARRDGASGSTPDGRGTGKETQVDHDLSTFDRAAALDRVGGDLELLIELASMFLEDCPGYLEGIETGISSGDSERVGVDAHTLKGAVGNFSAQGAFEAAFALEQMGKNGDLSEAPQALESLKSELAKLEPVLSDLQA